MGMTRRDALKFLGLAGISVAGCRAEEEEAGVNEGAIINPFRCGSHVDERVAAATGASPPELRKYEKIVVLMMENRSFDHYFGHLSLPKALGGEGRKDVDGLTGEEVQFLTREGGREAFKPFLATDHKIGDIDHEWSACHGQFNGGKMDGFIQKHFEDLERLRTGGEANCIGYKKCAELKDPMAYFGRQDTPVFHELFDNYALCDRWFSSVMGPTWPNRFYLHAATACGITTNERMNITKLPKSSDEARTIWHELDSKCVSAINYCVDFPFNLGGFGLNFRIQSLPVFQSGAGGDQGGEGGSSQHPTWSNSSFEQACELGILPTVSVIDPAFILSPCDDHPPHDMKSGQAFVAAIYKMLSKNVEQWSKTLLIITYDEHGSFYDHVSPPQVKEDERAEFRQLGFRVPALVVGPYVKKNHVSHVQYDHVSFLSTVTRRFDLTPLNARVRAANDVRDCIDLNAVETDRFPNAPVALRSVQLSESLVHESIKDSLGQSELADRALGGPATLEQKRRATDSLLGAFDRLGVANIRR
jgi:phospholipase C